MSRFAFGPNSFPITNAPASACAVSIAGIIPSVLHSNSNAAIAASSLIAPSDWTVSKALNAFTNRQRAPQIIGEWNGSIITLMYGYRGAFLKWGTHSSPPVGMKRPKVASLLKSMIWETVSLDSAVRALSFPRKLGRNPFDGKQVLVCNGPFGTYVRSGTRNKKLVNESAAFSITLQ